MKYIKGSLPIISHIMHVIVHYAQQVIMGLRTPRHSVMLWYKGKSWLAECLSFIKK